MKSRSIRLAVEALDDRIVPSTVEYADFNKDGLLDVAKVTSPTTITVSLAKSDGSYAVSAVLSAPKNLPIGGIYVSDTNGDGNLDISAGGLTQNRFYSHVWLGNDDGTFDARISEKGKPIPRWWV